MQRTGRKEPIPIQTSLLRFPVRRQIPLWNGRSSRRATSRRTKIRLQPFRLASHVSPERAYGDAGPPIGRRYRYVSFELPLVLRARRGSSVTSDSKPQHAPGSSMARKAYQEILLSYTLGGRSKTTGSLEGTAISQVGNTSEFSVTRNNTGGRGEIPGEQQRHRSSGSSLVTIFADAC